MKILTAQLISEASLQPVLNVIILQDDKIFIYMGVKISRMEIEDIKINTGMLDVNELVKSKIKDSIGEEISVEQAVIDYPSIKSEVMHILRDKKIDQLL